MKYISPSSYFSQVSIFSAFSTGLLVGSVKLGEVVDALEALVRPVRAAQRLLDLRPQRGRMLREAAELLQHLQPQRPQLLLQQRVGEEAEERVGLRALLRLCGATRAVVMNESTSLGSRSSCDIQRDSSSSNFFWSIRR